MAELPLAQGIDRFKQNEDRMDRFTNGTQTQSITHSDGQTSPSIRKFLKDKDDQINMAAGSILEKTIEVRDAAILAKQSSQDARDESELARDNSVSARDDSIEAKEGAEAARDQALAVAKNNLTFATESLAQSATIDASIHSVNLKGKNAEGDGNGGLYLDTNTGSSDSFTSADGRTWYRSPDVSKDRIRDGELPLVKLTNSPSVRLVGRDWSDVDGPLKSLTPEIVRALLNVPDNEALASLARAALDFRYGTSNVYDYLRLPPIAGFNEGFLIQWGVDAGAKTIAFPTPFPKAVCFVGGTIRASLANYVFSFGYTNLNLKGFDASPRFINTSSASGVPSENYNWIALGY